MIHTYQEYQDMSKSLSFEDMNRLHQAITEAVGNDDDALELYEELIQGSISYANIRAKWSLMSIAEKMEADAGRTISHDSLIVKFNQLARYLTMSGRDTSWRDELGYEEDDPYNRKRIGDMGCYLAFVHACCSR